MKLLPFVRKSAGTLFKFPHKQPKNWTSQLQGGRNYTASCTFTTYTLYETSCHNEDISSGIPEEPKFDLRRKGTNEKQIQQPSLPFPACA